MKNLRKIMKNLLIAEMKAYFIVVLVLSSLFMTCWLAYELGFNEGHYAGYSACIDDFNQFGFTSPPTSSNEYVFNSSMDIFADIQNCSLTTTKMYANSSVASECINYSLEELLLFMPPIDSGHHLYFFTTINRPPENAIYLDIQLDLTFTQFSVHLVERDFFLTYDENDNFEGYWVGTGYRDS
jgi:hypothetical protein